MSMGRAVLRRDVDLAPLTTYKLGGTAHWYAEVRDIEELKDVLADRANEPCLVLGRGSNIVFSDAGYDGLVVRLVGSFMEASVESGTVTAGGGLALPKLARFAAAAGRGGLEFFVGIPGSVGGAVRMNAGGHGSDTAAVLRVATILPAGMSTPVALSSYELDMTYRSSNLGDGDIVLDAVFASYERDPTEAEAEIRAITRWRKEHQPGGTLNAGSVFKNPPGDAAGRIIDSVGLKGYRRGAVSVSEMHANFFVAHEGATAQDVWDLVWAVRARVGRETGIWLAPEIRFAGAFAHCDSQDAGPGEAA